MEHVYTVGIYPYTTRDGDSWLPGLKIIINGGVPSYEVADFHFGSQEEAQRAAELWAMERREMTRRSLDAAVERIKEMQGK